MENVQFGPILSSFRLTLHIIVLTMSTSISFIFDFLVVKDRANFASQLFSYTLADRMPRISSIGRAFGIFGGLIELGTKFMFSYRSHAHTLLV